MRLFEHVRMSTDQFVTNARRDIGHRESTFLFSDRRVELDLVQQVAEFFHECVVGGRIVGVESQQSIDDFVGLLQEIRDQRSVCLLAVPGALASQCSRQLVERDQGLAHRFTQLRDEQRREVIGFDDAVDVRPRGSDDLLVGQTEVVENDRLDVVVGAGTGLVGGQLDVGQDPVGVTVSHQHGSAHTGRCGREFVAVHQSHARLDRVDGEAGPDEIEKADGRMEHDLHTRVVA